MRVLGDIARLNARRYPDKNALIMDNAHLTFRQLNDSANRLANGLISLGVAQGDRVALLAENCLEFVIVNYAVAKCGAILVPVNFRYKKKELVYVVNDSEPSVLLHGPEFSALLAEAIPHYLTPDNLMTYLSQVQVVLDGLDNLRSRRDLFQAAQKTGVPLVHGAVGGKFGQGFTILP